MNTPRITPLRRMLACLGLAATLTAAAGLTHAATFVALDPTATFLHTFGETTPPPAARVLLLADLGLAPGDRLLLQVVGDVDPGPGAGDSFTITLGLFSSSSTLLGHDLLARVPGALASDGPGVITVGTEVGNQATDIPQDFFINRFHDALVTVPVGAQFLFLAHYDGFYSDNPDPDQDYGVMIGLAPVPEPATWALWAAGLGAVWRVARRRGAT